MFTLLRDLVIARLMGLTLSGYVGKGEPANHHVAVNVQSR
jgi:hypothetical protein